MDGCRRYCIDGQSNGIAHERGVGMLGDASDTDLAGCQLHHQQHMPCRGAREPLGGHGEEITNGHGVEVEVEEVGPPRSQADPSVLGPSDPGTGEILVDRGDTGDLVLWVIVQQHVADLGTTGIMISPRCG